jgi:hypothetical protein
MRSASALPLAGAGAFVLMWTDPADRRVEVPIFNALNTAHYNLPAANFDSTNFSRILQANTSPPRQVQIGVKYIF